MLNQYVEHAIHRAEFEDIGINFIALPEFFEIPLGIFRKKCFSGVHCRGIPAEESGSSLSDFSFKGESPD